VLFCLANSYRIHKNSFSSQAIDGIGQARAERADKENDKRDKQKDAAAGCEDPPAERGLVGEVLQPFTAAPPANGYGDQDREADELEEVAREEDDQVADAGANDLADADLLCPLVSDINDQAEEAEAADEDGEPSRPGQEAGDVLFRAVKLCDRIVHELILEVIIRIDGAESFLDGCNGRRPVRAICRARLELYVKDVCVFCAVCDDQRFYRGSK